MERDHSAPSAGNDVIPTPATVAAVAAHEVVSALHRAAESGDLARVTSLLAAGANTEARDEYNRTPLQLAAGYGHEACLRALLAAGADKEARDREGMTALHHAVQDGREECLQTLLAAGADMEAQDSIWYTPIQLVLRSQHPGELACAVLLAAAGADPVLPRPTILKLHVQRPIAAAVCARLAALHPDAVAAARARLAAAPADAEAAAGPNAPAEIAALLRAEAAAPRIAKAYLCFREDWLQKLAAAKASGSLGCIEYSAISTSGREIAFRDALAAMPAKAAAAAAAVEAARERQQWLVDERLEPESAGEEEEVEEEEEEEIA